MTMTNINAWYKNNLGHALLEAELAGLACVLPETFGYYIAAAGDPTDKKTLLATSSIHNHIIINPENISQLTNNTLPIKCNLEELPFLSESLDAMVLFHILDFSPKPNIIIKECYNALINGGSLIIMGFNPYSLFGITKLLKHSKKDIWQGNWISPRSLQNLLLKIGFDVKDYQTFYFRPPSKNTKKLLFMEGIGGLFWPYCGASYMLVAKKTATILTPVGKLNSLAKDTVALKELARATSRAN